MGSYPTHLHWKGGSMSEPVRIILGETATKALLDAGDCFLIVGKGSWPDAPGRMVIYCQSIPKAQADGACLVAMGKARAVKAKAKPREADRQEGQMVKDG